MGWFRLDAAEISATRARAASRGASAAVGARVVREVAGARLPDEDLASLLLSTRIGTEELLALARERREAGGRRIETFSPLYLTNECDAECRMCGMRGSNDALVRE